MHLVTSFVSFRGLMQLTDELRALTDAGHEVRLLLGVAPSETVQIWAPARLEADEADSVEVQGLCRQLEQALRAELNGVPFTGAQVPLLRDLGALLADEHMACRRYERGFLHAKIIIAERRDKIWAITGSSNLTFPGLRQNQEYNAVVGRAEAVTALDKTLEWWDQSVPYDLGALIRERFLAYPPALIYLRMLYEVYGDQVNADPSPCMDLKPFQRDGVAKVRAIVARYGGALIADDVGLGKTYIAGEVARLAVQDGHSPVVVVAPASLTRMWRDRMRHWGIGCEAMSYHRLVNLYKAIEEHGHRWLSCGVLILDEAHAVRNPATERMEAVRSLLSANPAAQVLLLSATPVNNHAGDLLELLALADRNLEPNWTRAKTFTETRERERSLEGRRLAAVLFNPLEIPDEAKAWFFETVETRMLRRDRPFIPKAYADTAAEMPFPEPAHIRVDYKLTSEMRFLLADVLDAVGYDKKLPPELAADLAALRGGHRRRKKLSLAIYQRHNYRLDRAPKRHWPLLRLVRALLCKRIESSVAAFAATAEHMISRIREALKDLDAGVVRIPRHHAASPLQRLAASWHSEIDASELDDVLDDLPTDDTVVEPASLYDTDALRADLTRDLHRLENLAARARTAIPRDPKKKALAKLILQALADPRGPKIVIFASSRETTDDLGRWLEDLINTDERFGRLRNRIANLGGRPKPPPRAAERMLGGFAPQTASTTTTEATAAPATDDYDVLICTDMFSEGINLQQAALCVNYDLTWNPQRLGQRVGRLARVGSKHTSVTCWTILPNAGIEVVLHIMDILTHKAKIAAETVGMSSELFPDSPFKTYTSLLDTWKPSTDLPQPDPDAPVRDHGWMHSWLGNALRIPAVEKAITTLPHTVGAIHPARGTGPSVVFCFRILTADHKKQSEAFALLYAKGSGRAGATVTTMDTCLRHARVNPTAWMEEIAARGTPPGRDDYEPMRQEHLALVWSLLDRARAAVATERGIPTYVADERVQLITWMLFTGRKGA